MTDKNKQVDERAKRYQEQLKAATRQAWYVGLGIAGAWVLFTILVVCCSGQALFSGTFGDSFGFLTALFTGLALAGLWYTIRLQHIELSETRDVLEEQSNSLKRQSAIQSTQLFEGTFFQLLRRLSDTLGDIRIGNGAYADITGRAAVKSIYESFYNDVRHKQLTNPRRNPTDNADGVLEMFEVHLRDKQSELRHYFRVLYHVFKLIRESKLDEDTQARYASLARAQLSSYELCLLFYNGLVGEGAEGMKDLIERYGLLKHVDPSLLIGKR